MRQSKAKRIKKAVYKDYSPKDKQYTTQTRKGISTGAIECGDRRTFYQQMKKLYYKGIAFEEVR